HIHVHGHVVELLEQDLLPLARRVAIFLHKRLPRHYPMKHHVRFRFERCDKFLCRTGGAHRKKCTKHRVGAVPRDNLVSVDDGHRHFPQYSGRKLCSSRVGELNGNI
ncbi:unnamed protein product, partial [Ectocarpus sp. 13 AM-2016]